MNTFKAGQLVQLRCAQHFGVRGYTELLVNEVTYVLEDCPSDQDFVKVASWRTQTKTAHINVTCLELYDPTPVTDEDVARCFGLKHCESCTCVMPFAELARDIVNTGGRCMVMTAKATRCTRRARDGFLQCGQHASSPAHAWA